MKLNYKNRKSDGPKLGHIVAKDLRKQTRHCFAKAEPRPNISPLVIELDGKRLTDDGCVAMIEGLTETLESRDGVATNKLEELHLTGNELTTVSLRALAPVLELARFELVDLDLSDNNVSVKTDDEARDWEIFLKAFCGCRVLRRIDLSRNNLDGPRAFEILARVYAHQPPVDPTQLEELDRTGNGHEPEMDSTSDLVELTNRARNMSITSPADDPHAVHDSMSAGTVLKRREGLRAVPYIVFNDTGMTDAGALFFSYILQKHYYPQQLMCPLRPGPQATQLDEYRQRSHCWGLVYLPNDNLTETGRRLLGKAEDSRSEFTGIEEDMAELQHSDSVGSFVVVGAKQASAGLRRRSDAAVDPSKKHAVALDVENYRKKIQRNILEDLGYDSIDLWRCAVKMLTYAKAVMLGHEQGKDYSIGFR
ncbi:Leucine rich repeat domain-containing protein [Neofusicoccum parvum]|nr:Leucine rich repeat domain-containing protein [Neofusicoccum parvum]